MCKICFDRILSGPAKTRAAELAVNENAGNLVPSVMFFTATKPFGASSMLAPAKMALYTGKKWRNGRRLGCYFMDGSPTQRSKVAARASVWSRYANITFDFTVSKAKSDIRISFGADAGSWSFTGTDALAIDKSQPTMNFGWLRDNTPDAEYDRVVAHEFGHALGCIHEHQNPKGGIKWNLPAVYQYFAGPPNNWSKEEIDANVIGKYSVSQLNASAFDAKSIMLYEFGGELIQGGKGTRGNSVLSAGDKAFIAKQYPRQ